MTFASLAAAACFCVVLTWAATWLAVRALRSLLATRNRARRKAILSELGISRDDKLLVGFFHPYCNAGGGGERVLWTAVACMQQEEPTTICLVYTGDVDATKAEMVAKVQARFSIQLDPKRLQFVYLKKRYLVEDTSWKHFTLIGQSLGSVFLAHEGLLQIIPDVFIDTMGYALTFPLVKLYATIPVGAYVHYPTISTDMLQRVRKRAAGHTNVAAVANSSVLSYGKLVYYLAFARLYVACLRRADLLMANSTWTHKHITTLLQASSDHVDKRRPQSARAPSKEDRHPVHAKGVRIIYPPCDTKSLATLPLEDREALVLSIAQFRPEKEHATQLRALDLFLRKKPRSLVRLIMAGSVRNAGDEARVQSLRALAKQLKIEDHVEFVVNSPYPDLVKLLGRASVGLSTMIDEHFGISVVEFMAAGLIPLVHASAGPLLDIVVDYEGQRTGYHAKDPEDFAQHLSTIMNTASSEQQTMRRAGRAAAIHRFSEARFNKEWLEAFRELVKR